MYHAIVTQLAQTMDQLLVCLDKAEVQLGNAQTLAALMDARLAPDMKPLIYQVQSASDYAKAGAAWLSGMEPPRYEDTERTIAEVRERIRKTTAFMRARPEADFGGAACRVIKVSWGGGKLVSGQDYALKVVVPNVLFHVSMAYAILRQEGVDVGKADFLGPIYPASAENSRA